MKRVKVWIECMRLRTLPVSVSGVLMGIFMAVWLHRFSMVPAVLCLAFAVLAQVVSNMANEYYDFRRGTDKVGRDGPRRGVTEGDISPRTLLIVTYSLLALTALVGCCLIPYGGWWLLPVGIVIALAALAYSAGPYPLSYHGLGEVMVFIFFGLVPVNFTFYVQAHYFSPTVMLASIAIGLMGVNVLLVNNYRDMDDDREAGKRTVTVMVGRRPTAVAYLINGFTAMGVLAPLWIAAAFGVYLRPAGLAVPFIYLTIHSFICLQLTRRQGRALNPLLGLTALNMLLFTLMMAAGFTIAATHLPLFPLR